MGEESSVTLVENPVPCNTAVDYKKSTKPIMEKRRRARINASLLELKALLLDVMRQEGVRHQKMEKADILEMAVKHLRQIQNGLGLSTDSYILNKYNAGFNECANEVSRYLNDTDNVDIDVRTKILDHLMNVVQGGDNDDVTQLPGPALSPVAPSMQASPNSSVSPISLPQSPVQITGNFVHTVNSLTTATPVLSNGQITAIPQMQVIVRQTGSPTIVQYAGAPPTTVIPAVNAPSQMIGGMQLIPVQLANGEVVFAIPKQQQFSQQTTLPQQQQLTEPDETSAKEQQIVLAPSPTPVTVRSNASPSLQQHTATQQHRSPSSRQQHTIHQQHSPSEQQLHPFAQHQSPQNPHQNPQLPPQVRQPAAHRSVIKHTSPKIQVDPNNNDYTRSSHSDDTTYPKRVTETNTHNRPEHFHEKHHKLNLNCYESFVEYPHNIEPLNYSDSTHLRKGQRRISQSHHGLIYKNITDSRFQPYSMHNRLSQEISQQFMWRPW